MDKLSDALQAVALSGFRNPVTLQREDDLAMALFYAQVAWNKVNGEHISTKNIASISAQREMPSRLPSCFIDSIPDNVIQSMIAYKRSHLLNDKRIIVAVFFEDERIKVHWRE